MHNTKRFLSMLCVGVLLIIGGATAFWHFSDYLYHEDDFSLTISVDKITAYVGDMVTVTATFANISGKNILVRVPSPYEKSLNDLLKVGLFQEDIPYSFIILDTGGAIRKNIMFRKNKVITKVIEFQIEEHIDYLADAEVCLGQGQKDRVRIDIEPIKICVEG